MSGDCGCLKPDSQKTSLTRREFIKTSGVIASGAVLAITPIRPRNINGAPLASVIEETIKLALLISEADAKYQEADAEIQAMGLALNATFEGVRYADAQESLVGLVLAHSLSPSRRMGVDVALTVDINVGLLTSVHCVFGRSLADTLSVTHFRYDHRDELYLVDESAKGKGGNEPKFVRPRIPMYPDFSRDNSPPIQPEDLVISGWPPHGEDPANGYWHYGGVSQATWVTIDGEFVYVCAQVKEINTFHPELFFTLPVPPQ